MLVSRVFRKFFTTSSFLKLNYCDTKTNYLHSPSTVIEIQKDGEDKKSKSRIV